jgi:hypothetical protein
MRVGAGRSGQMGKRHTYFPISRTVRGGKTHVGSSALMGKWVLGNGFWGQIAQPPSEMLPILDDEAGEPGDVHHVAGIVGDNPNAHAGNPELVFDAGAVAQPLD